MGTGDTNIMLTRKSWAILKLISTHIWNMDLPLLFSLGDVPLLTELFLKLIELLNFVYSFLFQMLKETYFEIFSFPKALNELYLVEVESIL